MKYPIVIQIFSQIRENGYVYVDKTDFIYQWWVEEVSIFLTVRTVSAKVL